MEVNLDKILELSNNKLVQVMNRKPDADKIRFEFDWHHGSLGFYINPGSDPETDTSFEKVFYEDGSELSQVEYRSRLINKTCFVLNLGIIENYPEILDFFKEGYLTKKYNQIDIVIDNKKFVSYTPVWNQTIIDNFEKKLNPSQPYRAKYLGTFKPWYLDEGNFTKEIDEELKIDEDLTFDNLTSLTKYFKSISVSTKEGWDCTILSIHISGRGIRIFTKEEYVYLQNQDPAKDKPYAYIHDIKFNEADAMKIVQGINAPGLWNLEFVLKADGTCEYYVLEADSFKWVTLQEYTAQPYDDFYRQLEEAEKEEYSESTEPITSDYLLQNIYGCISANVPDDFASIEAIISRNFDGDTQQLSGSYSYKPKGLFSSSKSVEPGEQIYPINVTIRLLDEFYTEQSKDWRKVVLTFKNDGTCNVKIGK